MVSDHRNGKSSRNGADSLRTRILESMTISATPMKISTRGKKDARKAESIQCQEPRRHTLKEMKEKKYPFPDSDVEGMLEDLLEKKVIELPECKRPEEMNHINHLKYCMYHRVISHPVEKCFVLKDLIMKLAQQGRNEMDLDKPSASLPPLRAHVALGLLALAPACPAQAHIAPRPSAASPSASPRRRPRPTPPFFHFKPSACRLRPVNLATLQQMHAENSCLHHDSAIPRSERCLTNILFSDPQLMAS
ncbi:hypothetical protein L3X38_003215 [Prunus dulcis]|uniref:Retrotransposon gag protein n=1 Tax=Prunus dulcis TaxID=3755 RepID=A0AAD4ZLM5_PRUDU|nr:hypothetical protein L3X38_003215 [Prunus dulcis]